jgi:hypothetical protein
VNRTALYLDHLRARVARARAAWTAAASTPERLDRERARERGRVLYLDRLRDRLARARATWVVRRPTHAPAAPASQLRRSQPRGRSRRSTTATRLARRVRTMASATAAHPRLATTARISTAFAASRACSSIAPQPRFSIAH